ncbi:MAG: hypothetical protein EXS03_07110 [Phycisphaerales bacterium]|nr:hypothetical protein [Phycisphaerales bacterium]
MTNLPVPLGPLRLGPLFKHRTWGGSRLHTMMSGEHAAHGEQDPIGEAWLLSDLRGRDSAESTLVTAGPLLGRSLHDLLLDDETRRALLGRTPPGNDATFPLLVKILDARESLSVQVHPRRSGPAAEAAAPKDELWFVLEASEDARVYRGIRDGVTSSEVARRARDGTLLEVLVSHSARPGDAIWIPSGTCHALGAGLVVAEVQTPSDTTYRLWDWNRADPARPLHIDSALAAMSLGPEQLLPEIRHVDLDGPCALGSDSIELLQSSPWFEVSLRSIGDDARATIGSRGAASVWTILSGSLWINGLMKPLDAWETVVIPAEHGGISMRTHEGAARVLVTDLPDSLGNVREFAPGRMT